MMKASDRYYRAPEGVRAVKIRASAHNLYVETDDGNAMLLPWSFSQKLRRATPEARADYRLVGQGEGIHWPQVDEDVLVSKLWPLKDL